MIDESYFAAGTVAIIGGIYVATHIRRSLKDRRVHQKRVAAEDARMARARALIDTTVPLPPLPAESSQSPSAGTVLPVSSVNLAAPDKGAALFHPASKRESKLYHPMVIVRARFLWNVEKRSAAEIGRQLFLTKSQVMGIAHRNGFERRPSPIAQSAR